MSAALINSATVFVPDDVGGVSGSGSGSGVGSDSSGSSGLSPVPLQYSTVIVLIFIVSESGANVKTTGFDVPVHSFEANVPEAEITEASGMASALNIILVITYPSGTEKASDEPLYARRSTLLFPSQSLVAVEAVPLYTVIVTSPLTRGSTILPRSFFPVTFSETGSPHSFALKSNVAVLAVVT